MMKRDGAIEPTTAAVIAFLQNTFDVIDQTLVGLEPDALNWQPGTDMNSIGILAVHVAGATRYWIGEVAGGDPAARNRAAEFETVADDAEELRRRLAETLAHSENVLARLTTADLAREVSTANGDTYTVAQVVLRALNHASEHKGHIQMIRQLWEQRAGV